ncbi:MAG: formimidoylglutamase [Bacteroidota bacterium]
MEELVNYQPPEASIWKGRPSSEDQGPQYWYQAIQCGDVRRGLPDQKPDLALLGYAVDAGVARNLGRIGAARGPQALRQRLGKLAFHPQHKNIFDLGDITCTDGNMEFAQESLAQIVAQLIQNQVFPILMGGGHDIAYGHFKGIWQALKSTNPRIGIINFDAHFDLRPLRAEGNSGTPFYQIRQEFGASVRYFALGIQKAANTPQLFDLAREFQVGYVLSEDCRLSEIAGVKEQLNSFLNGVDVLYISLDLDGFSSAYAPGVSAPSPMGFSPVFVQQILSFLFQSQKVISCDLAELNPEYDQDHRTAQLAAYLVDFMVACWLEGG